MSDPHSLLPCLSSVGALVILAATMTTAAPKAGPAPAGNGGDAEGRAGGQPWHNVPPNEVGGILFAGASGISHWKSRLDDFKDYKVIGRVLNGKVMPDMVAGIDKFFPFKPSIILMQLGGNDMAGGSRTPEQVFGDFKDFVVKTRAALPETVIIYMGLVPTIRRWGDRENHQKLNALIKEYTATMKNMDYIDEWAPFLGPDGTPRADLFIRDGQHNNEAGYAIRVQLTRPYLAKWHAPAR